MDILDREFEPWILLLEQDLETQEGYRKWPYDDRSGRPPKMDLLGSLTIGIGCNLSAGISLGLARHILKYQVAEKISECERRFSFWPKLSGNRKRALANLCFNMGMGVRAHSGLLSFSDALKYLREEQYTKAADAFLDSRWAEQVGEERSKAVTGLIRNG